MNLRSQRCYLLASHAMLCFYLALFFYKNQCCGSELPWCGSEWGSRSYLSLWSGSGCGSWLACHFNADSDPDADPTFHFDADPDPDSSFQIKTQNLWKNAQIGSYFIHFGLSSANWCGCESGSGSSLSLWCRTGCGSVSSLSLWCGSGSYPCKLMRIRVHNTA
jgi:hypothetical protein